VNTSPDEAEISDVSVVHRVLSGESAAFRLLVERHQDRLYRFCLIRTRNYVWAEDAVQDIFIRAYASLATFRIGYSFRTWLFAIAANHLRTRWKKAQADADRMVKVFYPEEPDRNNPENEALDAESSAALHRALGELPADLYAPVYLYYFEGLPVAEIAEALGLGTENVKTRLFRGRKKLRVLLEAPQPTGLRRGNIE